MTSESGLFGPIFARGAAAEQVSDAAWLQGMLDAEAALAVACAEHGLIPKAAATAIKKACVASKYDIDQIGRDAAPSVTPVIPLVAALRKNVGEKHAQHVHFGATSQDIVDTAMMLVAKRAFVPIAEDLTTVGVALAEMAAEHRLTPMIGRTLLQQALPTTFGLKAGGWFSAVDDAAYEVLLAEESGLFAAQLGGAAGTLSAFGPDGLAVAESYAKELELAVPFIPWHTARVRPADIASTLGVISGVLSKIALDVILMSQDEVGEVHEAKVTGRGASSSMPHKRNSAGSVAITAIAKRVPGLVATIFGTMAQEHERAAGAWHAEWETLSELISLVGSQLVWARELIDGLEVDSDRMAVNLEGAVVAIGGDPREVDLGSAVAIVDQLLEQAPVDQPEE